MHTTTVSDVMTHDVVTAAPATPFKDLVDLMVGEGISALPVVGAGGHLLGVVSEADVLCKDEHLDDQPQVVPPRFARHSVHAHWAKATGLTAAELMTSPALCIASDASIPTAARQLVQAGVRRLCVVDGGRLVGVVARRDLLRPFLRGDREIKDQIDTEVLHTALRVNPAMVRVTVEHGVVLLTGRLEYQGSVATAIELIRAVPGVVAVRNRLDWQWNGHGPRVAEVLA